LIPKFNLKGSIPALVLKWSVTNPHLVPLGAVFTRSKSKKDYQKRAERVFGISTVDEIGNSGFELPETKIGRVGIQSVENLMNRFLRIEHRISRKPDHIPKQAILFFFVLNEKDLQEAVPMSGEHAQALRWFAMQTFEGCRIWNNGERVVIDLVKRLPEQKAVHCMDLRSDSKHGWQLCWVPLPEGVNPAPTATHPKFLTKEYVDYQRRAEEKLFQQTRRSLENLFEVADRQVAMAR